MSRQVAEKTIKNLNERIEYIDILRVLSMLSVVFLHTAAGSLRGNIGSPVWHFSNFLTSIMSTSVPIFFMISGALLMSSKKTLSIEITYKKRIPKVLIPFIVWSITAVAYYAATNFLVSGNIDWKMVVTKLRNIPAQPTTIHLWFMYALIPLYILSPVLKRLADSLTDTLMLYMLSIWLVFSSVLPTLIQFLPANYQSLITLNSSYNLNFMNGYIGYFLTGYFLMNYRKHVSIKLLTGIIAADIAVISLGSWWKTIETGTYSELFKSYSKLFIVVLSIAIFLLVKELMSNHRLPRVVSNGVQVLSSLSFGVYLVHNLIVDYVSKKIILSPASSIHTFILAYLIILAFSLICIFVLSSCRLTCYAFTGLSYKSACETGNIQYFFRKLIKSVPNEQQTNF